jgi:hypothetical protein
VVLGHPETGEPEFFCSNRKFSGIAQRIGTRGALAEH